ncbi:hypothetical protein MRX96_023774 [Rhipicephalus microplus]
MTVANRNRNTSMVEQFEKQEAKDLSRTTRDNLDETLESATRPTMHREYEEIESHATMAEFFQHEEKTTEETFNEEEASRSKKRAERERPEKNDPKVKHVRERKNVQDTKGKGRPSQHLLKQQTAKRDDKKTALMRRIRISEKDPTGKRSRGPETLLARPKLRKETDTELPLVKDKSQKRGSTHASVSSNEELEEAHESFESFQETVSITKETSSLNFKEEIVSGETRKETSEHETAEHASEIIDAERESLRFQLRVLLEKNKLRKGLEKKARIPETVLKPSATREDTDHEHESLLKKSPISPLVAEAVGDLYAHVKQLASASTSPNEKAAPMRDSATSPVSGPNNVSTACGPDDVGVVETACGTRQSSIEVAEKAVSPKEEQYTAEVACSTVAEQTESVACSPTVHKVDASCSPSESINKAMEDATCSPIDTVQGS